MQAASQGSRNGTPDHSFDHGGANSVDIELVGLGASGSPHNVTLAASKEPMTRTGSSSIDYGEGNREVNESGGSLNNRHGIGSRRTLEEERQTSGNLGVTGIRNSSIDYGTRHSELNGSGGYRRTLSRMNSPPIQTGSNLGLLPDAGTLPINEKVVPIIEPTRPQISGLSEDVEFWDTYLKEAEEHDREMIASWSSDLDSILIFAGLFSAVNTAFIVESYVSLKADPADVTNTLLRILINRTDNTTFVGEDPSELIMEFSPGGVRNNAVFFASLATSLLAAFGAVLAKQWLNQYLRIGEARSARSERGRVRQRKFDGLVKWKFQPVVEALPLLLQTSLVLFFIALIDFLWALNRIVGSTVIVLTGLGFVFYMFTTMSSALYEDCPFQTPISHSLRPILKKIWNSWSFVVRRKPGSGSQSLGPRKIEESTDMIDAQTVAWLLQTVSEIKPRLIATRAIRHLRAPAIHPYFAAKETIGTLMTSFASCFQDRRIDHDGKTVYAASPAVLDMVDAAGHALCRILSTAPHGPTHEADDRYPYADLLPSLDISEFLVEDSQGSRCYAAHHLSRVIRWMASGNTRINHYRIEIPGSQSVGSVDHLGVLSSVPSDWEKLQFPHVFNYISNRPDSLPSVEDDLISICCTLLEQRPLPPLNVLCDVLLTPAWITSDSSIGTRNGADSVEIQEARSSKSLNLCLLLFLEATTKLKRHFRECTPKLLDDLVMHGIHIGEPYTQRYMKCAGTLLDFRPPVLGRGQPGFWGSYELSSANPGLRIIDVIRPELYLQGFEGAPSTHLDEEMLLYHLNVHGARCDPLTSAISLTELSVRNVLSLLWALGSNAVGKQRQKLPVEIFKVYPNIPRAICHAIQVFRNNATSNPHPFNKTDEFPTRLLENCMNLWFDYREPNLHKLFIDAGFGETLLAFIPASSHRAPLGLHFTCCQLVNHLTSSRPDLWVRVFGQALMLRVVYLGDHGPYFEPHRWLSRLLLFWDIENELDNFDGSLLRNLWGGMEYYLNPLRSPRGSRNSTRTSASHPQGAQTDDHSHNRMLKLFTVDGLIAYTYMTIATMDSRVPPTPLFNPPIEWDVESVVSWRLEQGCPEDMAALMRCVQQRILRPHDSDDITFELMAKEPGINTWKRCCADALAYFADIDLQARSLESPKEDTPRGTLMEVPRWWGEESPRESPRGSLRENLGENLRESLRESPRGSLRESLGGNVRSMRKSIGGNVRESLTESPRGSMEGLGEGKAKSERLEAP